MIVPSAAAAAASPSSPSSTVTRTRSALPVAHCDAVAAADLPGLSPPYMMVKSVDDASTSGRETHQSHHEYDGLTFVSHMIAGAVAGTVEHTAMYPVDTIKTRMQALSHPGQRLHRVSLTQAISTALRREGLRGLYKGVGAVAGGAGPAHAMHFAVYEYAKELLGGNQEGQNPLVAGVAGAIATIVNDALMTPTDVVKQRLQVAHSPYKGVVDCVSQMLRKEGMSAFFKSYRTTLVMNIPFQIVHFGIYEAAKQSLVQHWAAPGQEVGEDTLAMQLVAGGLAGGTASALTTPFDVVKTRLQTEGVHSATRYGSGAVLPTMRRIVQEEGMAALWRGVKPRVLFHVPAAAVCWGTYETMKSMLGAKDN